MKKFAIAAVLVTALVLGSACTGTTTKTNTTASSSTTTTQASGPSKADCQTASTQVGDLFSQYAALIPSITTQAEVSAAITTGRALVAAGRTILDNCGKYSTPETVASINATLNTLETSLNEVEGLKTS